MDMNQWNIKEGARRDRDGNVWLIALGVEWVGRNCECQESLIDREEVCEICEGYGVVSDEYDRFRNGDNS